MIAISTLLFVIVRTIAVTMHIIRLENNDCVFVFVISIVQYIVLKSYNA